MVALVTIALVRFQKCMRTTKGATRSIWREASAFNWMGSERGEGVRGCRRKRRPALRKTTKRWPDGVKESFKILSQESQTSQHKDFADKLLKLSRNVNSFLNV